MATLAGQILGQYQVIERLGRGGMAEVYKGFHPKLERFAAIKVLHGFLAEGEDFLARFQREAKAIAALSHPNIVHVYDFDIQDDFYYMVIEFIDGGTLKDRLLQSDGPLPLTEMARVFRETASALDYAHHQGVLHRDIKPANILLDTAGRAVLTDFGIARIVSDTQFTATGTLVGTPAYMSPEQGKGLHVSESSDIYALGIVLYEMSTGRVPFEADTPFGVIHKHIYDPLPLPRTFRDDIPETLEAVILKALEKDPGKRYQTPAEMAKELDRAIMHISSRETIVGIPEKKTQPDIQVGNAEPTETELTPEETIASKSTVAMEPDEDIAIKATAVMEPEEKHEARPTIAPKATLAMETEREDIADKATVAMEADETPSPKLPTAKPQPKPAPVKESQPKTEARKRSIKPLPIVLGIVGLSIIVALLIWGIPKLTGSGEEAICPSIDECQMLVEEHWRTGDLEGAVAAIDTAIDYVPEHEHPPHAHLWCQRGELLTAVEQFEEALWNFEECMIWTESDPNLEDIRIFAQEQIDMLHNR